VSTALYNQRQFRWVTDRIRLCKAPELPELAIEPGFLPKLKERIRIAREIEKAQHQIKKENHDKSWLKEVAEAMDVDIDADML
jgi:ATP-dependent RNA helicase DDX24/MAK5